MKKTADIQKKIIRTILAAAAVLSCTVLPQSPAHQPQADAVQAAADPYAKKASITEEITSKRTKFTKEFVMSDGSFPAKRNSGPERQIWGSEYRIKQIKNPSSLSNGANPQYLLPSKAEN